MYTRHQLLNSPDGALFWAVCSARLGVFTFALPFGWCFSMYNLYTKIKPYWAPSAPNCLNWICFKLTFSRRVQPIHCIYETRCHKMSSCRGKWRPVYIPADVHFGLVAAHISKYILLCSKSPIARSGTRHKYNAIKPEIEARKLDDNLMASTSMWNFRSPWSPEK